MENKEEKKQDVVFVDINPDNPITEIESLCMNCQETGITRLMPTKIPYFKEIIITAFECPHCGYKNNEIESAAELPDEGVKFTLTVSSDKDLNRQVIKSNHATIKLPFCDLEIPPKTQKGKLSTVEGFMSYTRDEFNESIESGYYSEMGEAFITKIKEIITKLTDALEGKKFPFEFILDDPSGQSFIQNPYAPQTDQGINLEFYVRTKEMSEAMGYSYDNQIMEKQDKSDKPKTFINPSYYNKKKDFTVYKSNTEYSNKIIDFTKSIEDDDYNKYGMSFQTECQCCQKKENCVHVNVLFPTSKRLLFIVSNVNIVDIRLLK